MTEEDLNFDLSAKKKKKKKKTAFDPDATEKDIDERVGGLLLFFLYQIYSIEVYTYRVGQIRPDKL